MKILPAEPASSGCLLVVDDQEANIQVLGLMLGECGFEILPATDGKQALKRLASRRPDLILLDLIMPEMDGFEVCRRIRENADWAEIPIIFLSAANDKSLIVRALESGGVDYITKPFDKPELILRVRTHLVLKKARDELRQLAEDRDELLRMITHYVQNHLATMEMSAQLLLDRAQMSQDDKLHLMAENIRHSSARMRTFIKSLVANTAADDGVNIKIEPVNLSETARRVAHQYEEAARGKEIALQRDFSNEDVFVQADAGALEQVLDNFVSNGIKFSPPGRKVFIEVRRNSIWAECQVRDQGPGFTVEDQSRMYRRYARLSARPTGGEPSTGLGLNIAKKLTLKMGGQLTCQTAAGEGTAFILKLPLASPDTRR